MNRMFRALALVLVLVVFAACETSKPEPKPVGGTGAAPSDTTRTDGTVPAPRDGTTVNAK